MRGFLDCYGFRPSSPCITLDEMMSNEGATPEDDESEDMMDVGEREDDYLASMDKEDCTRWTDAQWAAFDEEYGHDGE